MLRIRGEFHHDHERTLLTVAARSIAEEHGVREPTTDEHRVIDIHRQSIVSTQDVIQVDILAVFFFFFAGREQHAKLYVINVKRLYVRQSDRQTETQGEDRMPFNTLNASFRFLVFQVRCGK